MTATADPPFRRDRFTWLAYLMLAYFAYLEAALGPLMPLLRVELALSYTQGGFHFSGLALGLAASGLVGERLAGRFGRTAVFWGGGAGLALAAVLLVVARQPAWTVLASFLMGALGGLLLIMIQATLSDHHGVWRAVALTEANVGASAAAMMVPLLMGTLERFGYSWRWAILAILAFAGVAAALYRGTPIPERIGRRAAGEPAADGPLPRLYWAYWLVLILGMSAEWGLVYWGADFLVNAIGLDPANAATAMTLFFLAMVIGRLFGSRLTRRVASGQLLLTAVAIALAGFLLFWLPRLAALNLLGLFIAGLGVANLYPLTLSVATTVAADQADKASARISVGGGAAIFTAPLLLGWTADRLDLAQAYAIVAVLLLVALAVTAAAYRYQRHASPV